MRNLPPPLMLSTRIPFAGTYESLWSHSLDSEVEQLAESYEQNLKYDRARFDAEFPQLAGLPADRILDASPFEDLWESVDYGAAYRHIASEYADAFADWLSDELGLTRSTTLSEPYFHVHRERGIAFEFEEMTSPRYYNFETDRLFGKLGLAVFEAMRASLPEGLLEKAFAELFTSYDGFASFYDPDVPDKPLAKWDHNELYALVGAFCHARLGGRHIDDELYDQLYELPYHAIDQAMDWDKLRRTVTTAVLDTLSDLELEAVEANYTPRCPGTLELPL